MLTNESKRRAVAALDRYRACLSLWDGSDRPDLDRLIAQERAEADRLAQIAWGECEHDDPDAEILRLLVERATSDEGNPNHVEAAMALLEGMMTE